MLDMLQFVRNCAGLYVQQICCQVYDLKCIENCARLLSKYEVCLYCKVYNCDVKQMMFIFRYNLCSTIIMMLSTTEMSNKVNCKGTNHPLPPKPT